MASIEGRIALALQAYKWSQFTSLRSAVRAYDIPFTTLRRRNHRTFSRRELLSPYRKLTSTEETVHIEWILSMDTRSILTTQALIRQITEILLDERV